MTLTRSLDTLLREVEARFPILGWSTPVNAAVEQKRLLAAWSRGDQTSPTWEAPMPDRRALGTARRTLDRARDALVGEEDPWLVLYRERLGECVRELAIVDAAFTQAIGEASLARFPPTPHDARADALAEEWLETRVIAPENDSEETIATDDERDPRSLLTQMRSALFRHGLGVRVVVHDRIGALAAAGDGVVIVARGRRTREAEARRVVLHEIEGHVLPRERGRRARPGLNTLGSAGASEDEEGRALLLEERSGGLDARRRVALGGRHLAARIVAAGATYVEVVRTLIGRGLSVEHSLATASRVQRGGHRRQGETRSGVARERIYLPAYLRVGDAVANAPELLELLGGARLSLAARALVA